MDSFVGGEKKKREKIRAKNAFLKRIQQSKGEREREERHSCLTGSYSGPSPNFSILDTLNGIPTIPTTVLFCIVLYCRVDAVLYATICSDIVFIIPCF